MGSFYHNAMVRYGFHNEADGILQAWREGDKSGAIKCVSDEMLDSLSISGSAGHGQSKMNQYRDKGADSPVILFPPKASRELVGETVHALAPQN